MPLSHHSRRAVVLESLEQRQLLTTAAIATVGTNALTIYPGQAVHVDALASSLSNGDTLNASYEWDFGDPNADGVSGPGVGGVTGNRNQLRGWTAAHVYDVPGQYTITLNVTDSAGQVDDATATVNVQSDSRRAIYVSNSGSGILEDEAGASAGDPVNLARLTEILNDLRGQSGTTNDARILFNRGEVFDVDYSNTDGTLNQIVLDGLDNITIDDYGTGAKPYIRWVGPLATGWHTLIKVNAATHDLVIKDLKFGRDVTAQNIYQKEDVPIGIAPEGKNNTIRNIDITSLGTFIDTKNGPQGTLVLDNKPLDSVDPSHPGETNIANYFVWVGSNNVSILGNYVKNVAQEHVVRGTGYSRVQIARNDFRRVLMADVQPSLKGGAAVTLQFPLRSGTGQPAYAAYAYVADNIFRDSAVGIGPLGGADGADNPVGGYEFASDRTRWSVFEANLFDDSRFEVTHGGENVMLRNNIVKMRNRFDDGIKIHGFVGIEDGKTYNRGTNDVRVLFNTVDTGTQLSSNNETDIDDAIEFGTGSDTANWGGHQLVGNLVSSNNPDPAKWRSLSVGANLGKTFDAVGYNVFAVGSKIVKVGATEYTSASAWNSALQSAALLPRGDQFVDTTLDSQFKPGVDAENASPYSGVTLDFAGNTRPSTSPWTSGAVERRTDDDGGGGGATVTIDFEGLATGVQPNDIVDVNGYRFKSLPGTGGSTTEDLYVYGSANGYASKVLHPYNWSRKVTVERVDGTNFSLQSFDYAGGKYAEAGDFTVTAFFADSSTDTETKTFSGKTLTPLPVNWSNLVRVEINFNGGTNGVYGALDNFVFGGLAAPTNVTATGGTSAIAVVWDDNTSGTNQETSFEVERQAEGTSTWSSVGSVGADTTSFSDTTAVVGTPYRYRVRAVNSAGESPWSMESDYAERMSGSVTVDFEGLATGVQPSHNVDLNGYRFTSIPGTGGSSTEDLYVYGSANGYASKVLHPYNWSRKISVARVDGTNFSLQSFDYAAGKYAEAGDFTVTAFFGDTSTDAETRTFSSKTLTPLPLNWSNLARVEINFHGGTNGVYGAVDNFVFGAPAADRLQAENSYPSNVSPGVGLSADGQSVTGLGRSEWIKFNNVDFSGVTELAANLKISNTAPYEIHFVSDISDPWNNSFAKITTSSTGGSFSRLVATVTGTIPTGTASFWLAGGGGSTPTDLADVDWVELV